MLVVEASLTYNSLINTSVSGSNSETIVQCFVHHSISDFTCLIAKKMHSHAHVCFQTNIECTFRAESFSLGSLVFLNNFEKLSTVCRNGQSICLGGVFVKAAFSR